jgi:dihydroneopterin aldolase
MDLQGGALRRVLIRDWVMQAAIGVYASEQGVTQRIRLNIDIAMTDETFNTGATVGTEELARVLDYDRLAKRLRAMVQAGHVRLVETLAERLAGACLEDVRVQVVRVRVEKLDVFPDGAIAGVEVERRRVT